jgi:endonuclease G
VPEPIGEVADDVLDVDGTTQWGYTHFSLAMSASRRLARWVAWNIDGLTLFPGDSIPRADDFRLDPRLPAEAQTGEEVYAGNDLDRGHLARRSDLLWGTLDEARAGNEDSFLLHQHRPADERLQPVRARRRVGAAGGRGARAGRARAPRLTLFGGPVLTDDDVVYRDVLIPGALLEGRRLRPRRHPQRPVLRAGQEVDPLRLSVTLDDFATYELSLADTEALLSLTFASLHASTVAVPMEAAPRRIDDVREISW